MKIGCVDCKIFVPNKNHEVTEFFQEYTKCSANPKISINWLTGDIKTEFYYCKIKNMFGNCTDFIPNEVTDDKAE